MCGQVIRVLVARPSGRDDGRRPREFCQAATEGVFSSAVIRLATCGFSLSRCSTSAKRESTSIVQQDTVLCRQHAHQTPLLFPEMASPPTDYGWTLHPHLYDLGDGWAWPASAFAVMEPYVKRGAGEALGGEVGMDARRDGQMDGDGTTGGAGMGIRDGESRMGDAGENFQDAAHEPPNEDEDTGPPVVAPPNTRKRKRNPNPAQMDTVDPHLLAWLEEARKALVQALSGPTSALGTKGISEDTSRDAGDGFQDLHLVKFGDLASLGCDFDSDVEELSFSDIQDDASKLFNTILRNASGGTYMLEVFGHTYVVPRGAVMCMSDLGRCGRVLGTLGQFDCIVMDPPWPNKSVRRSAHYTPLDIYTLFTLPLPSLLAPGALIAVWVTNKPKYQTFVREKLFPAWGVGVEAEWYWVKVTRGGEWVLELGSLHRKPYEVLIIGRKPGDPEEEPTIDIPARRAICSVPSKYHSRKPFLDDVLTPYIPATARKLELFARNLLPGWTSWGNEVLKFNDGVYLERRSGVDKEVEGEEDRKEI
ncbi:MT-A70-domain-containing protein [Fimicolochytrium jonesii]|uniref:MT-A70-domain-containing protein n=1 Tax=Fimicolochytrium jonesii TaxID=1396493 RepID=UPI0022FDC089|nr:MT-A70-domain-containing protein [Fimicolochytrium jonesii]KAI8820561.1 MT-A70-domain-containing protein [Fimicolochytrium jonesii]